ncbi:cysteine peptidase family C39 domain-containing protein [Proteiniphilum sp.]|uniref:cysteine peptidase family C39 domain-containing protein n=1 Tax=Proteiniphilum sp. TaxID=1926877 RepID=UPI0033215CF7
MELNNYLIPLLIRHLKQMEMNCDPEELQLVLQSSPSFPSVLSIVQVYTYYGLKATACRADYSALVKAKHPVIAFIKDRTSERFILIEKTSENGVCYFDAHTNKRYEIQQDEFCLIWTKITILIEKTGTSFCRRKPDNISRYWLVPLLFSVLFFRLKTNTSFGNIIFFYAFISLKVIGTGLSMGLLRQEAKGAYSFFDAFCQKNAAFDCNKVIHSKGSKVLNRIALADIGFIYFSTGIISLLVAAFSGLIIPVLQIFCYLAVCSIPFILFSVLYQKLVVEKWCPLCLSVVAILLIEMVLFLFYPYKKLMVSIFLVVEEIIFSLLLSIGLLFLVKQNIRHKANAFQKEISSLRLKRTPAIIANLFKSQQKMQSFPEDGLKLGNREAPITITTLLNPMCTPCKRIALQMIRLLERYPLFIQWHVRLDGTDKKMYENMNKVQFHLFTFFDPYRHFPERVEVLKEWFRSQSIDEFEKVYPVRAIGDETKRVFYNHVKNNKVLNTDKVPSIWMNDHPFPNEYTLEDLPFLLTDLVNLSKSTR